jgi:hypothetical protein
MQETTVFQRTAVKETNIDKPEEESNTAVVNGDVQHKNKPMNGSAKRPKNGSINRVYKDKLSSDEDES